MRGDKDGERERTGEMGFCAACGAVVPVVVVRNERSDRRVFRAVQLGERSRRWRVSQFLAHRIARLIMRVATAADLMSYGVPAPLLSHLRSAADEAALRLTRGRVADWPHLFLDEGTRVRIGEELVAVQIELFSASGALEVLGDGERWDLAKRAVEKMEQKNGT